MRIKQLPPAVANQIAAGEVIERPASIVKELLENSLDANADSITLEIGYGGLNQVKISDNGDGIWAEDLPLAIAAHATSKISQLQDLYAISSMGFRGEALASIASIARVSISSKPALQENGMQLICNNEQYQLSPFARSQGTTIDVRDIFFNAPVRKKFLKPERYEFQAIEGLVKRFALSCSAVAIKLIHNEKQILHLPAAVDEPSRFARMTRLLGKQFVEQALYIDCSHAGIDLRGWISGKTFQRSQNDKLWVYINGRMVKDRLIHHAIKQAYENLLHPGRYPACLLYLTLNPCEVDVNVHPTKHEVRFQQPRLIHDFISSQLSETLKKSEITSSLPKIRLPEPSINQIRESIPLTSYTLQPRAPERSSSNRHVPWMILHNRFAICTINQQTYLLDLEELKRHWLLESLQKTSFPLMSRPLLVPIGVSKPVLSRDALAQAQGILIELGIQNECLNDTLLVRSLPVQIPHLVIKTFMTAFFELATCSLAEALLLLPQHQMIDSQPPTQEQQENYVAYLQSLEDSVLNMAFIKPLSEQTCQDLLDV